MNSLLEAHTHYMTAQENIDSIRQRIQTRKRQIERLERKLDKAWQAASWVDVLIRPLAEALASRLGCAEVDVLGPFGLNSRVSIWFFRDPVPRDERGRKIDEVEHITYSVTVRPGRLSEGLPELYYETGALVPEARRYARGTLGEVNGDNNEILLLPDGLDEIAKIVRTLRDKKED